MPSAPVNRMLTRCFAGERHRLAQLAIGASLPPYRCGVSLMALLRRTRGKVHARCKPANLAADVHDPAADELVAAHA
jgi:hypothetical protein